LKKKKRQYVNSLVNNIVQASANNPKLFWNTLKELKGETQCHSSLNSNISPTEWFSHFQKLNKGPTDDGSDPHFMDVIHRLTQLETYSSFNELDFSISSTELISAIKHLKNNKAVGSDSIANEMLKNCNQKLLLVILKLFNVILQSSRYPHTWSEGIISTIHKSGDSAECNNYRGITISSCLGKLFSTILNQRLLKYVVNNKLIPENQIGFMPNSRTSDHVFILKNAIDKYLRRNKKLYACFIDFRKAFDTVWHDALFLKLREHGIGGLFYNIVKNMYKSSKLCVRTARGLTPFFSSNVGVRQGCALSPLLFNLFISDLQPWLDNDDAVRLFSRSVSHLLYADDLVILSESPNGLQTRLSSLNDYCVKWKLYINPDKSKVMIFCKTRKKPTHDLSFTIGDNNLEIVDQYKYLGVLFSSNGSFQQAKIYLEKKARRGLFGMHSYLSDCSLPPSTSLDLYEKLIQPIASYGAEVWAPFCISLNGVLKQNCCIYDKHLDFPGAKTHLKFCKRLLGVHEKSVNLAVLGELGQLPTMVNVLTQCINFWFHILQSPVNSFLYDSYICGYKDFYDGAPNKWFQLIKFLSQAHPILAKFWEDHRVHQFRQNMPRNILRILKLELANYFETYWFKQISNLTKKSSSGGRLAVFHNIKQSFNLEGYLNDIKNPNHRHLLTRLRIGSHKLAIETGRRGKTPRENRICTSCQSGLVQDEFHFLIVCDKSHEKRQRLYNDISILDPEFQKLTDSDKFKYMLSTSSSSARIARFVYEIYPS
jgi:hypothetical protein